MKKLLVISCFLLCVSGLSVRGQDMPYADPPALIGRISFVVPRFVLELAPSEHFTFTTGLMLRPSFSRKDGEGNTYFHPLPRMNPKIYLEPRFFFNSASRASRGKRTDYYSGWFVGMPFTLGVRDKEFSMATSIGFQCTFGRRWYWNWEAGSGMNYEDMAFKFRPVVDVGFGVIISR